MPKCLGMCSGFRLLLAYYACLEFRACTLGTGVLSRLCSKKEQSAPLWSRVCWCSAHMPRALDMCAGLRGLLAHCTCPNFWACMLGTRMLMVLGTSAGVWGIHTGLGVLWPLEECQTPQDGDHPGVHLPVWCTSHTTLVMHLHQFYSVAPSQ